MSIIAIIQSRMTSSRYPGKVLAPFLGKPVLAQVVERIKSSTTSLPIVLATSDDTADDPLVLYGNHLGISVERGPRDDVMGRFVKVLGKFSCEAFFRVCGDSPLLLPFLFNKAVSIYKNSTYDLITNVFPRTFPIGMSVELVSTKTFLSLEKTITKKDDREHLTQFYYNHPEKFRIRNIECDNPVDQKLKLAVDEIDDLKRIERWYRMENIWDRFVIKQDDNE